jgi:hypothetical protein
VIDPVEAKRVQQVFRLYLKHVSPPRHYFPGKR